VVPELLYTKNPPNETAADALSPSLIGACKRSAQCGISRRDLALRKDIPQWRAFRLTDPSAGTQAQDGYGHAQGINREGSRCGIVRVFDLCMAPARRLQYATYRVATQFLDPAFASPKWISLATYDP
jgi:hypothetical protein